MSVRFDAATDRISYTAASPPDPQAGFTTTFWAWLSATTGTFESMLRIYTVSGDTTRLNIANNTAGTNPHLYTSGNTGGVAAGDTFTVGSWMKIGVTQTGTTGTIYTATVGGSTHSASGTASGGSTATGLTFGGRSTVDSSEWFNGRIAYARYWSAVLTQTEIESEWAAAAAVRATNLWADWPLTVFTDLTDHSGNGRNLVAGSTSTTTEADPPLAITIHPAQPGLPQTMFRSSFN